MTAVFIVFAGFIVGAFVLTSVLRWVYTLWGSEAKPRNALVATLLSSGPWALVALAVFARYTYQEDWAPGFFAGVVAAWALLGLTTYRAARRFRAAHDPAPLRRLPYYVRFALWAGPRKKLYIIVHTIASTAVMVSIFAIVFRDDTGLPFVLYAIFAGAALLMGIWSAWERWESYIWPLYAAFPGHPSLPPSIKPFEGFDRNGDPVDVAAPSSPP